MPSSASPTTSHSRIGGCAGPSPLRAPCKAPLYHCVVTRVEPESETLGQRIKRLRKERGMSLAKVVRTDFSRAFLNQVELGRAQPSTRVLRVIADRLGTRVDYLLEGRLPELDRELALERARLLLLRGYARRALVVLEAIHGMEWPLST